MQQVQSQEIMKLRTCCRLWPASQTQGKRSRDSLSGQECHHLRNEWWKSLEDFRKYQQLQVISHCNTAWQWARTLDPLSPDVWWDWQKSRCQSWVKDTSALLGLCLYHFPTKGKDRKRLENLRTPSGSMSSQLVVDLISKKLIRSSRYSKGRCGYAPWRSQVSFSPPHLSTGSKLETLSTYRFTRSWRLTALNYYWLEKSSCKAFSIRHPTGMRIHRRQRKDEKLSWEIKGLIETSGLLGQIKANDQISINL